MARDIRSLVDQFLGKRNVFRYKKTALNQMHLMYWLVGEFYYSDVFNRTIRICWGLFLMLSSLIMFCHCLAYIIFSSTLQFPSILCAIQVTLTDFYLLALFPLVSYIYRKDTAEALEILDRINHVKFEKIAISADIKFAQRKKYGANVLLKVFATNVGMGTCFFICSNLYLMIGFTAEKLKEPDYYFYPTYCEKVEDWTTFVILSFSQFLPSVPIIMMALFVPCFSLAAAREFYHRFQSICDTMDYQSELLIICYEQMLENKCRAMEQIAKYEGVFARNISRYGKCHRDLLRAIAHLKKYLQFSMSASVVMFLYNEIMLIYIVFVSGSIMAQIKALNMAAGVGSFFYVNCLIGKLFSDMGEMFNESVYNMPWYYLSPSKRKSMYFFLLLQAQVATEFKGVKIYPIDMTFFLRMCNYVYSSVNVLRRYYKTKYGT